MERSNRIAALLNSAVTNGTLPGAVAIAVNRDGTIFEAAAALPTDAIFWLASMTKAIVSVAAMQLVERNRLHLDAPIATILPALAAPQVLEGFDAAGTPLLRPARTAMTLRHLLTHTAGYGYNFWNAELGRSLDHALLPRIPTNLGRSRAHAAAVRPRHALDLRHQHRHRRPRGGGRERPDARRLSARRTCSARSACTTPVSC